MVWVWLWSDFFFTFVSHFLLKKFTLNTYYGLTMANDIVAFDDLPEGYNLFDSRVKLEYYLESEDVDARLGLPHASKGTW